MSIRKVVISVLAGVVLLTAIPDAMAGSGSTLSDWYMLPAVAHLPGKFGTFWQTDVAIVNPYTWRSITVEVYYLPRDQDNTYAVAETVTIPAAEQVTMTDVVRQTFGVDDGSGALLLISNDGAYFSVNSRTYTGTTETFGLTENGQKFVSCGGESAFISGVRNSSRFRTNVGAANPSWMKTDVLVEAFDDSGGFRGDTVLSMEPWSMTQVSVNSFASSFSSGYLVLSGMSSCNGHDWIGYATPIDNNSGDSTFSEARTDTQYTWARPSYDQTGWWEGSISTAHGSGSYFLFVDQAQSQLSAWVYNPDGSFNTRFDGFENQGSIYLRGMFVYDARCFGSVLLGSDVTSEFDAISGIIIVSADDPSSCLDGTMTLNFTPTAYSPFKKVFGMGPPRADYSASTAERPGKGKPHTIQPGSTNR